MGRVATRSEELPVGVRQLDARGGDDLASRLGGVWYNQFGSRLELLADPSGGLSGTFQSGVGGVAGAHPLTGFYDSSPEGHDPVIAFVVCWPEAHTVTAWSGHYHVGDDLIEATWLLTGEASEWGEWRATRVGQDLFGRTATTQGRHAAEQRGPAASHPARR